MVFVDATLGNERVDADVASRAARYSKVPGRGTAVVVDADVPDLLRRRMPPLRFKVGDRVAAHTQRGYVPGEVVQRWYREPDWPEDRWVPYQIRLDHDGVLTYCRTDDDNTVRLMRPDELAASHITGW